jgi:2-dehydro-3-deoxygalactonokinase
MKPPRAAPSTRPAPDNGAAPTAANASTAPLAAAFITGDWGTSQLRLSLCAATGQVLDRRTGPGVSKIQGDFGAALATAAGGWLERRTLPVMLCGMVGSNIGWTVVPYLACPLPLDQLSGGAVRLDDGRVAVAPGLSCVNLHGAPDRLRGEETQVLGALELNPALRRGSHLLCLPGTHAKWVLVEKGSVREFLTSVTGELFALVRDHSVLVRATDPAGAQEVERESFQAAAVHAAAHPRASLLHLLFECRSRQISGELSAAAARAFLSGLLIADEVGAALAEFRARLPALDHVTLVGDPVLTSLYATVCGTHGIQCSSIDGDEAATTGLTCLHATLF